MRISLVLLGIIMGLANPGYASNSNACKKTDARMLRPIIVEYVTKHSLLTPKDFKILSQKCIVPYASAVIHPLKPVVDDAAIYLHKVGNQWTVLSMGTWFDENFLATIPKALRNPRE